MLWYKAWQESRWRFLSGLVLLMVLACGIVFDYPVAAKLMPLASSIDAGDSFVGRAIKQAIEAQRDYRGFVWWQWVRQNLTLTWTLFALLLAQTRICIHAYLGHDIWRGGEHHRQGADPQTALGEHMPALQQSVDHRFLAGSERIEAEDGFQNAVFWVGRFHVVFNRFLAKSAMAQSGINARKRCFRSSRPSRHCPD